MYSRRSLYVLLGLAVGLLVLSLAPGPSWLQLLAAGLGAVSGGLAVVVLLRRGADPNGPPGQH